MSRNSAVPAQMLQYRSKAVSELWLHYALSFIQKNVYGLGQPDPNKQNPDPNFFWRFLKMEEKRAVFCMDPDTTVHFI